MGLSRLTARIKSAILPGLAEGKTGLRSRDGLYFAAIVAVVVVLLYAFKLFVSLDETINALIMQYCYLASGGHPPSPHLLMVKKDERTSRLIGRNPERQDFASIFRFLGRSRTKEFPSKGSDRRITFFDFRLGWVEYSARGPVGSTFQEWDWHLRTGGAKREKSKEEGAPAWFPFQFREDLIMPRTGGFWQAMDGPAAVVTDRAWRAYVEGRLDEDPEAGRRYGVAWQDFLLDLAMASLELEIRSFPKGAPIPLQISLVAVRKARSTYVIPPAKVIAFDFVLDGEKKLLDDAQLVEAIRTSSAPIILGASVRKEEVSFQTDEGGREGSGVRMVASQVVELRTSLPAEKFVTGPVRIGFINVGVGGKGFVSQIPVFVALPDGTLGPAMSLVTAAIALDRTHGLTGSASYEVAMNEELRRIAPLVRSGEYKGGFTMRDIFIPTNEQGFMNVNFFGSTRAPPRAPFLPGADFYQCFDEAALASIALEVPSSREALAPEKAHFKTAAYGQNYGNKICMVGPFELSDFDYFPTPFTMNSPWWKQDPMMMGVEIHANAVHTILTRAFIRHPNQRLVLLILVLATLVLGVVLDLITPVLGAFVTVGMLGAMTWGAVLSFKGGQYFSLSPFVVAFPLTWGLTNLSHYIKQREKARGTKEMFGRFVSPDVVDYLISNPGEVKPGGQKVELTIFFSDLAGFTTISESLSPEGLVVMMNEYLGTMTELLFKHGGTLDKYIGDAVMAYWNFPKKQDDHAVRALLYTLEMHEKLKELQADWARRGLPKAYARAGINTAHVVVGCIGSKTQMNFTCLGDGVNLASRLEGANKEYGTLYMCSDATYQKAKHRVRGRFLDFLAVKGKKEPVKVHEIVCEVGHEPPWFLEIGPKYEEAIQLHLERKWDDAIALFEEILARYPEDGPSKTYLKRCHEYKEAPPPDNWDGSYHLTHK
ncbi:MAG: Adenylate cyclase [Candidatus Ozemobacter sibiricus]|jgi:class 3 adenylate cyclase|uniref:Adenylate cyclase n=1 Tax=Candidatus Ozemobacter sibiricus TaxID=2268124 RepID=A0A367ZL23_9BACT|nr:MAG: Adenylate cyclase [Candidatus Ozemobacter sibiricus]